LAVLVGGAVEPDRFGGVYGDDVGFVLLSWCVSFGSGVGGRKGEVNMHPGNGTIDVAGEGSIGCRSARHIVHSYNDRVGTRAIVESGTRGWRRAPDTLSISLQSSPTLTPALHKEQHLGQGEQERWACYISPISAEVELGMKARAPFIPTTMSIVFEAAAAARGKNETWRKKYIAAVIFSFDVLRACTTIEQIK
jgi:hypothetical protein